MDFITTQYYLVKRYIAYWGNYHPNPFSVLQLGLYFGSGPHYCYNVMTHDVVFIPDDWQQERGSLTYFLGDPIHLEASVILSDHMPQRIYVERCVATVTPDADATLRYDFIEHHG